MISVENITKTFDQIKALNGVSFCARPGEILGLLGPNGAGKTTTLKIIATFWQPDSGQVNLGNCDVIKHPQRAKQMIGYLPENVPLYDDMKVYEYLHFVAEMRNIEPDNILERIKKVSLETGLNKVIGQTIAQLSKGYKQRVGLAQAIIHDPDILILDEPTTGLDPNQIIEIRELIKKISQNKTIIFSSHILSEVSALCDRVVILNKGKVVAEGTPSELSAQLVKSLIFLEVGSSEENVFEKMSAAGFKIAKDPAQGELGINIVIESNNVNDDKKKIAEIALKNNWLIYSLETKSATLEDVFREFIK